MEKAGICRYFQKGNCKLRGNCPYVHKKEQRAPCKFHAQGFCKFGDNCNFYHAPKQGDGQPAYLEEREVKKLPQQPPEPRITKQLPQSAEADAERLEKIRSINALLRTNLDGPPAQVKKPEEPPAKVEQVPVMNYARRILVSFVDLSKTAEGKENTERVNRQVYQKPYLEYLKDLTDPVLKEQAPIMRRYQYAFRHLSEDGNKFSLKLSPFVDNKEMKLNFDIPERCLQLVGTLHPRSLEISNKSIPQYFRHELNWQFESLLKTRSVYETLKYLENYFERICEQVDFILENKRFNENDLKFEFDGGCEDLQESEQEKEQEKPIRRQPEKSAEEHKQVEKPKAEENCGDIEFQKYRDEKVKKKQTSTKEEEHHEDAPPSKEKEVVPEIELTNALSVQTLETNCESLMVEELLVHLQCQCSAMITYIIKAKGRKSLTLMSRIKCSKCKQPITVYTQRYIMLRNNNGRIAQMGCINAKIEDVGAVLWKVNCVCERVIINDQLSLSGVKKMVRCFDCFRQYFIQYYGMFVDHPERPQVADRAKPKMEKQKESGMRFKLDTELPNKGACRHYKFSFRWLRFACCGRAFPCDRCHQQATEKHDYDRADVMICGMCSQQAVMQCSEQPFDSVCRRCKKELVKGSEKSGHWQGGKGCRDQTLLSRNDPKKYTGLSKTAPNKK